MKNFTYRQCQPDEKEAVTDIFFANREALCLPDRPAAANVTELLFAKGYVIGGYHDDNMVGVLGYFLGEPQHDFANKNVLYLYVGAILPEYQLTRIFFHVLLFIVEMYQGTAVTQIRLQAESTNPYTNKLYGRFAQPLAREKSPRGVPVITYGAAIEDVMAFTSRFKRPLRRTQTPQQYYFEHRIRPCVPPHNWQL